MNDPKTMPKRCTGLNISEIRSRVLTCPVAARILGPKAYKLAVITVKARMVAIGAAASH